MAPDGVQVPIHRHLYCEGRFISLPPAQGHYCGKLPLGTLHPPDINVDVALTIPRVRSRVWVGKGLPFHHLQILDPFFPPHTLGCEIEI